MSRNNSITEGTILTDVETAGGYNYYGMVRTDGSFVIMREATTEDEYRFFIGNGINEDYATAFSDYANKTYKYAYEWNIK